MSKNKKVPYYVRLIHRYLGFFLAGIMSVYAISGVVLIFRNTDFLKYEQSVERKIKTDLKKEKLGKALRIRNLKITKIEGNLIYFKQGVYNKQTGVANYTKKDLAPALKKLNQLHKSTTNTPLYWLNIFFGFSLLFFSLSAFWMYLPKAKIFRKGLYFAFGGIVLTLLLLFM